MPIPDLTKPVIQHPGTNQRRWLSFLEILRASGALNQCFLPRVGALAGYSVDPAPTPPLTPAADDGAKRWYGLDWQRAVMHFMVNTPGSLYDPANSAPKGLRAKTLEGVRATLGLGPEAVQCASAGLISDLLLATAAGKLAAAPAWVQVDKPKHAMTGYSKPNPLPGKNPRFVITVRNQAAMTEGKLWLRIEGNLKKGVWSLDHFYSESQAEYPKAARINQVIIVTPNPNQIVCPIWLDKVAGAFVAPVAVTPPVPAAASSPAPTPSATGLPLPTSAPTS